jgi:hypothetical protein
MSKLIEKVREQRKKNASSTFSIARKSNAQTLSGVKSKKSVYLAVAAVGVAVGGVVLFSLLSGSKSGGYSINSNNPKLPPQTPNTPSTSSYTPTATTSSFVVNSKYNSSDTMAVQAFLYRYYPKAILSIGDIGTNGKPDGIWGNNTQKVVDDVVENWAWNSVDELVQYAKKGVAPSYYSREF